MQNNLHSGKTIRHINRLHWNFTHQLFLVFSSAEPELAMNPQAKDLNYKKNIVEWK